ncbi:MAG: hypothetical protein LBG50_04075 [Clostridiales Family XIII bacterium]|nr:hypothetical protein [Clostridiales Family XIII bacterium]
MDDLELPDIKSITNYVQEDVFVDTVTKSIAYQGVVYCEGDLVYNVTIPEKGEDINVSVGSIVMKGDSLSKASSKYAVPFFGKVGELSENESGTNITVVNYSQLSIGTQIAQKDLPKVKMGDEITFIYNEKKYSGFVSYIGYQVVDGKVEIHIAYDDPKCRIRPGSEVSVVFIEKEKKDVTCIGKEALKKATDSLYYAQMYDENGNIVTVDVEVGLVGDSLIEVLSGLDVGDTVLYEIQNEKGESANSGEPMGQSDTGTNMEPINPGLFATKPAVDIETHESEGRG